MFKIGDRVYEVSLDRSGFAEIRSGIVEGFHVTLDSLHNPQTTIDIFLDSGIHTHHVEDKHVFSTKKQALRYAAKNAKEHVQLLRDFVRKCEQEAKDAN